MTLRIISLLFTLLCSQYAAAEYSLFYEDNQFDYYSWGVRYDTQDFGGSRTFGLTGGISIDVPTVIDQGYLTSYGHLRASLFPRATLEPFASVGIDLAEFGVLLFSDGDISPQVDTQLAYGLRINFGDNAIDLYHKISHLTGYTIIDGTYNAYGIALAINF